MILINSVGKEQTKPNVHYIPKNILRVTGSKNINKSWTITVIKIGTSNFRRVWGNKKIYKPKL